MFRDNIDTWTRMGPIAIDEINGLKMLWVVLTAVTVYVNHTGTTTDSPELILGRETEGSQETSF